MRQLFAYLKFLLTSSNQHGVHSPFVYRYVTQCLYAKPSHPEGKNLNVLLKGIAYFKAERIWIPPDRKDIKKKIQQISPSVSFDSKPFDILFVDIADNKQLEKILSAPDKIHNDSMLLVDAIHQNKKNETSWEQLKKHQKVTVSIDMFFCGAIFFRREQAREHFRIRI